MASELRKKNITDLRKLLSEKREALRLVRFGEAGSRGRNVRAARMLRREIARILTELRVRDIATAQEVA